MNVHEAAKYLGIAPNTLYNWKRQARKNNGFLILHGIAVRFRYRQTGAGGQGRISFDRQWLDAIRQAMEGTMQNPMKPALPELAHIHVELGTPR